MTSTLTLLCFSVLSLVSGAPPNIILISVDTLRPDHLGCYGYSVPTSPYLDAFARQGMLYEDCVCVVPLTSPSLGAMFSSQYPRMTGTVRNGLKMPEGAPLVPDVLHKAGYQTLCVQSNWTLKGKLCGLNRGFEEYEENFHTKRWGIIKPERYAEEVTDVALRMLEKRDTDRSLFFWVHYCDPHAPYRNHTTFKMAAADSKDPHRSMRRRYDSEVAYTDFHIQRLLEKLPKENTYIVFTADHGESLGEHDHVGHGRHIYQIGLQIPFIITGPGIKPGRSSLPVCGLDIGPTLLGLAGVSVPKTMLGMDLLQETVPLDRVRYVETYGGAVPHVPGAKALLAERPPMCMGIIKNGYKLIVERTGIELYHLQSDPQELNSSTLSSDTKAFSSLIMQWDENTSKGKLQESTLSEDDIQAIKSLGYAE